MRVEVYGCLPNPLIPTQPTTNINATITPTPPVEAQKGRMQDEDWSWGAYLGIVFAVLLIIGIVVAVIFWKKKSKEKKDATQADESLMGMHRIGDGEYRVIKKNADEPDDDDENLV